MTIETTDLIQRHPDLFFQQKNGQYLVIEPANFKWAVVDERLKKYLDFIEVGRSAKTVQDNGFEPALLEDLYKTGLVRINGRSEYTTDFQDQYSRKELSLIILHTSNRCNFRCSYCYLDSSTGRPMDFSVAKSALDQAARLHDHPVGIQFHGGEPLLNFGLIKEVVAYGNKFRRSDGSRKFTYSIQTNLSLIDVEMRDYFIANEVAVGYSIDGPPQFNDRTRVYKNGKSTFRDVIRGLKLLQERDVHVGTLVVVSDISVVDTLYDFMIETGIQSLKLIPYSQQGRAKEKMPVQTLQIEYAHKLLQFTDRVLEHNARSKNSLKIRNISFMLHPILGAEMPSMCMRCPCGAGASQIGIDVDGSVFPCESMKGKRELSIGNITRDSLAGMLDSPLVKQLKERSAEQISECRTCELRNICKIGCPNESYNKTGTFTQKTEMCAFFKVIYPELMWRVYEHRDSILTLV